ARFDACHGPIAVAVGAAHLVVDCLLDRSLRVYALDEHGVPRAPARATITHDGPMWAITAPVAVADGIVFASGGVEDHPLDRSEGFGYVDSFVYLHRVDASGTTKRLAAQNVS